jgi:hypothetical protein
LAGASRLVAGRQVRLVVAAFQGVAAIKKIAGGSVDREACDIDSSAGFGIVEEALKGASGLLASGPTQ